MNKKIFSILLVAMFIVLPFSKVNAASLEVKTLEASIQSNKLSISGTTDSDVLAVTIMIYDSKEENLLNIQTTAVSSDNKYSEIIDMSDDTYVVKVANYDGGKYVTKTVSPEKENVTVIPEEEVKTETEKNPQTYDGIMTWVILGFISMCGVIGTVIYMKKQNI